MTEAEWLACDDSIDMLLWPPGKTAGDRKLRLFACACCRRIWDVLSEDNRSAVELAERYADGKASQKELADRERNSRIYQDVNEEVLDVDEYPPEYWCDEAAWQVLTTRALDGVYEVCEATRRLARDRSGEWEDVVQARLLRDVLGNPFRPIALDPAWLTWHGGLLVSMAQQMYESRDFTDMPILADALEEAGCTSEEILTHCRQSGEHVRGCWVVDLLLGKE
jgi:hypothetical protein